MMMYLEIPTVFPACFSFLNYKVDLLTIADHIVIVDTTYLGSNSSTIRLSDSPYEKRKSGGTECLGRKLCSSYKGKEYAYGKGGYSHQSLYEKK